jgi:hypothetical protein
LVYFSAIIPPKKRQGWIRSKPCVMSEERYGIGDPVIG